MAPLPEENTARLWIKYTSGGQVHEAEVRLPAGSSTTTAATAYAALTAQMAPVMATADSITGARYAASGSVFSFPLAVSAVAGSGGGAIDPDKQPIFFSFTGRSSGGRRCRFTMFTMLPDPDADGFRDGTPSTAFNNIRSALIGSSVGAVAIDGLPVIWNTYVNLGSNAYWQRKNRKTNAH